MSITLERPDVMSASATMTAWLEAFDGALQAGDAAGAAAMFVTDCFWRDLVSFTWNITTQEGQSEVVAMLESNLSRVRPSHWELTELADEANGVITGWIRFETAVARGTGHLRLRGVDAADDDDRVERL